MKYKRDSKSGRDEYIPMNETARAILTNHPRASASMLVFPNKHGKQRVCVRKAVARIKKRAGISKDFRVLHWLIDHFLENKSDHVTASHILNFGPTNLRNAKARDEALVILKKHGHVNLKEDFRTVLIKLNPKLIPSVANANLANLD